MVEDFNKAVFECTGCGTIIECREDKEPTKCCNKGILKKIAKKYAYSKVKEAREKFQDQKLLGFIRDELSKNHLGDDNLKLTGFLTGVSGLQQDHRGRMSIAFKGDSSVGKDNLIKSILKHMPDGTSLFLTSGTQATIEDDTAGYRILGFSELNKNREAGANKFLVEVLKQKSEGGTSSLKKDIRTGMKTARHEQGEQTTVLYGTTEADTDEELGTRFIMGYVEANQQTTKKVNDNTAENFADVSKILRGMKEEDSWIKVGLSGFLNKKRYVYLPYAEFLKGKINETPIIDSTSPRARRDFKRLLWLTCATTFLYQEQRKIERHGDLEIIRSEPEDFLNTLKISGEFFEHSYEGIDGRWKEVLSFLDEKKGWVARDEIERRLKKSKNTIKNYCGSLSGLGLIEGTSGREQINQARTEIEKSLWDYNKIYYRRCQKGIKRGLIGCQILELKEHFESELKIKIDTLHDFYTREGVKKQGVKMEEGFDTNKKEEIDTLKLTPYNFTEKELEATGMKDTYLELMKGGLE